VNQYREDRDPRAPLFQFKSRALVHFAADPDEVHMTTRLAKERTHFLPFNRGSHPGEIQCGGATLRVSPVPNGLFWKKSFNATVFLDILGHFMFIEKRDQKKDDGKGGKIRVTTETVIFPRYHQLDACAKTRGNGPPGRRPAAITWFNIRRAAARPTAFPGFPIGLASLHNEKDEKTYDCVVVITDRRILDQQLQDAIYQIEHAQGVVKAIDQDAKQLAAALIDGTKIVITQLAENFPFVLRGLLHAAGAENQDQATDDEKRQAREWEAAIGARKNMR